MIFRVFLFSGKTSFKREDSERWAAGVFISWGKSLSFMTEIGMYLCMCSVQLSVWHRIFAQEIFVDRGNKEVRMDDSTEHHKLF